jgi:hypothetical protein
MSDAAVRLGAAGELYLSGVLDYRTGPALRKQGQERFPSESRYPGFAGRGLFCMMADPRA